MDFPAVASATAATGLPVYYRGEDARDMSGLYHPPLYIYLLAGWIRVFGSGEASVRLFGMTCAVIQGLVVLLIVRTLFGAAVALRGMPFFWAIFLLNPYTLQSAAITDIDSTIYGPLLCLALLAALRISWRDGEWRTDAVGRREYAWVAGALFVCFWAKLTTVWLVIPAVFLLWISRLGVRRAAVMTAAVAGAALAGFAGSYWLYGALTGLDISYTFTFTWESFLKRGASLEPGFVPRIFDHWNNLRFMILFMTAWTGLLPWAASGVALWFAALGRRDRRSLHYGVDSRPGARLHLVLLREGDRLRRGSVQVRLRVLGADPHRSAVCRWSAWVVARNAVVRGGTGDPLRGRGCLDGGAGRGCASADRIHRDPPVDRSVPRPAVHSGPDPDAHHATSAGRLRLPLRRDSTRGRRVSGEGAVLDHVRLRADRVYGYGRVHPSEYRAGGRDRVDEGYRISRRAPVLRELRRHLRGSRRLRTI